MRLLRWLFIVFQFALLNAVLPGHTRGVITLPGPDAQPPAAHDCCAVPSDEHSERENGPTGEQRQRCAVCHFAARVCAPVACDFRLTELGFIELLATPAIESIDFLDYPTTHFGRAPPIG